MEALREARWLAAKELRRTWLSYPATGLFVFFFGFMLTGWVEIFSEALDNGPSEDAEEATFGAYYVDVFFLALGLLLVGNYVSRDYLSSWVDSFSKRLYFLRSLPISVWGVVMSRMLTMVPALVFTVPALFLPVYFLSEAFASQLGPLQYLWFAAIWVGYGFFWAGLFLYLELGIHGKTYNWLAIGMVVFLLFLFWPLDWLLDLRLVGRTIELVGTYGALPAIAALLVGITGFVLWGRATVRRIERRDLSM